LKPQFQQIDNKVAALVQHCLYMIATGKWPAGTRLPSVRASEKEWDLNRLTIQKAFRQLEQMGLVSARAKSGYYVNNNSTLTDVTRHRYEM
jgi:DNA-binding transcriptional regulator YhcF (GntR family)